MANVIRLKRASGSDPAASDLVSGEPAVRTDTGELFFKKDDGSIAKVAGAGGGPDFKYLALRNAANNGAASYPNADFTLVRSGTTTALVPTAANTLLVSVNGVIQKPNTGTSTPSSGFALSGSTIKFGANLSTAPDFILYQESGGIGEPSDDTVSEVKLKVSNSPVNGYFLSAQSGNTGGLTWAAPIATSCTGNSATATALATARTINGVNFDGTAAITVTAAAGTLTGTTLNSSVVTSSLTSLGDLSGLTVTGDVVIADSIIHSGDTNTKLRFPANDTISFETGGSERLKITSSGNVHINGTPPWSVTGGNYRNLSISGEGASASGFLWLGNGSAATNADFDLARINFNNGATITSSIRASTQTSANDDGRLTFHTQETGGSLSERVRIDSAGKVGVGESASIDARLHVNSGTDNATLFIESTDGDVNLCMADNAGSCRLLQSAGDLHFRTGGNANAFGTGDSERMVIDSSGKVGINEVNPTEMLHIKAEDNTDTFGGLIIKANNNSVNCKYGWRGIDGSADVRFAVANTERVRIDSSGNLLIGTTSYNKGNMTGTASGINVAGATPQVLLHQTSTDKDSYLGMVGSNLFIFSADSIPIVFGTNDAERMRITSDGKVGIKTSSPIGTLDVHDGTLVLSKDTSNSSSRNWQFVPDNAAAGNLGLRVSTAAGGSTFSNVLEVTSSGQILQGETSAFGADVGGQFRFDNAGGSARYIFRNRGNNGSSRVRLILSTLNNAANGDTFSGIEKYQSGGMTIFNGESNNNHAGMNFFTGSWCPFRVRAGNISGHDVMDINQYWGTSNGIKWDIGGPQSGSAKVMRFTTSHYGGERGSVTVNLGGTAYNTSSDYRMKQDIVSLTGALDRIKNLLPKRFKWKEDPTYTVDGFLAHEAKTVVPESVTGEKDAVDSNGSAIYQSIDQSKLVPLLVAAVQELAAKVEALEAK